MIVRSIKKQIDKALYKGKVVIIYGARRTGKTTLVKAILKEQEQSGKKNYYINCELLDAKRSLETTNEKLLKNYLGNNDIVVLDEAQNIENIGLVLKIMVDTYPQIQIIATGSSSFDLAGKISEPLTGRNRAFILYPFSVLEIQNNAGFHETSAQLSRALIYGMYPSVYSLPDQEAKLELMEIASSYLYKDILTFEQIKNSKVLVELLALLALQVGNEVSYTEIAQKLGVSNHTVKKYIDLLEKCFVVFSLRSFSRNLRNEINKSQKIYFYDLGIRNAIIQNFNKLSLRTDLGALWENFCIIERLKYNQDREIFANKYFWRMYSGPEIDYIEERDGQLACYEFKYSSGARVKRPTLFLEKYKPKSFTAVNSDNWFEFML
ncbi:putative AAA family ATPase [Candidatus Termititenax persephonae]|uniref:AAA family ATPase n=1 Tax=Candidatus Termititenax persephonae TaxID=2218525 RepID=A0A388THZ4_9BACT|nr:putative AAA family ATPase [Candidatus Termititenax persephonae]